MRAANALPWRAGRMRFVCVIQFATSRWRHGEPASPPALHCEDEGDFFKFIYFFSTGEYTGSEETSWTVSGTNGQEAGPDCECWNWIKASPGWSAFVGRTPSGSRADPGIHDRKDTSRPAWLLAFRHDPSSFFLLTSFSTMYLPINAVQSVERG